MHKSSSDIEFYHVLSLKLKLCGNNNDGNIAYATPINSDGTGAAAETAIIIGCGPPG